MRDVAPAAQRLWRATISLEMSGGPGGTRTPDNSGVNGTLYHLSYRPLCTPLVGYLGRIKPPSIGNRG